MTTRLDSLRVGAELDASKYQTGAQQMSAADRAMIASKQALGAAFTQADTKVSQSGDSLARLSRTYIDGYKNQERFEQGLRQISRQLDAGKTDIDGATRLLVGMGQKLGVTADASALFAQGQVQLATAVGIANTQLEAQISLIERARAEQAAANSQQIAAANQNKVNGLLGVGAAVGGGAVASASVFEAEFARLDTIAQQRAAQIGANFGADLETSLVAGTRKSARDAAAVFADELDRIDQIAALKAQQAGGYFQQDLNARFGIGRPVNSARASADVFANAPAGGNPRLNSYQLQGLGYQANDIVTMALLGASPGQIAFSQGGQVLQNLQMGEGGIKGSLSAIKSTAADAAKATVAFLGTTGLIATGFGAAAVAAGAFYLLTRDKAKSLDDALKGNKQAIMDVADAYGIAGLKADDFGKKSKDASAAAARTSNDDLRKSAAQEGKDALAQLTRFVTPGRSAGGYYGPTQSEFKPFDDAIQKLNAGVRAGHPDFDAFEKQVQAIVDKNPGLQGTADKILGITTAAAQAWREISKTSDVLDKLNKIRLPEKGILPKGAAGDELAAAEISAKNRADRQFAADQLTLNAKSPQELAAAARARAGATFNPDETAGMRSNRIELAGKQALLEAEHQLKEAEDQRQRSILQTVAAAKLDADLVGKSTAAVEAAKFESQQLAQVREEAARNGITSEAEFQKYYGKSIELIRQQAAEYGKLIALEEARSTINQQQQDIELGKTQLATINDNTLARNRAADAARTEQQIRQLGIPLYGAEAEAMRKNTAALSDQADAIARATLQRDLMFERQQILMNSDDAQIASRLQSAGLPIDLNSMEAQMMRYNMALSETKDTFKGFFTDMFSGLREGKSLWESFRDAAVNALGKIADKLIDRGLDGIFNSIFGDGQAGSSGGGLLGQLLNVGNGGGTQTSAGNGGGSFLSKLLGVGGAGQSVATMQVQAATVIVNGGIGGGIPGLDAINSFLGGSSFKPDTTLSDILGYGGAGSTGPNTAATAAKLLSGLGSPLGAPANDNIVTGSIFKGAGGAVDLASSLLDFSETGNASQINAFLKAGGVNLDAASQAWCAAFVNSSLKQIGITGSGSSVATSFLDWGKGIDPSQVLKGDVLVEGRGLLAGQLGGHVGFATGATRQTGDGLQLEMLSGNSSNKVGTSWVNANEVSVRRATEQIGSLGDAAKAASSGIGTISAAGMQVSQSLVNAAGGLTNFGSMLSSFMSSPTGGGSSWFQGLSSLFGGTGGALNFMSGISPMATADILSGSWGLFDRGGWTGPGDKDKPAGIVHAGEIVWSQDDIRRAGGAGVVEGMRLGYRGYAAGGAVLDRNRFAFGGRPSNSIGASAFNGDRRDSGAANDRPTTINQTNNFIFRDSPAAPASQNQIAAKNARQLERLQRTA